MSHITARVVAAAAQRQLTLPLLVLLAGQRPLAFLAGQMLYAAEPLCALIGLRACADWAAILSDPEELDRLTTALDQHSARPVPSTPPSDHVLE